MTAIRGEAKRGGRAHVPCGPGLEKEGFLVRRGGLGMASEVGMTDEAGMTYEPRTGRYGVEKRGGRAQVGRVMVPKVRDAPTMVEELQI